ncbi:hypothetical protein GEMRC1_005006 [Eukaryota sp. GEM-RC1]
MSQTPPKPPGQGTRRPSRDELRHRWRARAVLDDRDVVARRNAAALMASDPALKQIPFGTAEYFAVFDRLVATWQNIVDLPSAREQSQMGRVGDRRRSISFTPDFQESEPLDWRRQRRHTITAIPEGFAMPGLEDDDVKPSSYEYDIEK